MSLDVSGPSTIGISCNCLPFFKKYMLYVVSFCLSAKAVYP